MDRPADAAFLAQRYDPAEIRAAMAAALDRLTLPPDRARTLAQWDALLALDAELLAIRQKRRAEGTKSIDSEGTRSSGTPSP